MENFAATALFAIIIVIGGLLLLSVGWLLTGKSKLQPGACGRNPTKGGCKEKRECHLCDQPQNKSGMCKEEIDKNDAL